MVGNSFRGNSERLGAGSGKTQYSHVLRGEHNRTRDGTRQERYEPRTTRGVSGRGEGRSLVSDKTSGRFIPSHEPDKCSWARWTIIVRILFSTSGGRNAMRPVNSGT